MGGGAKKRTKKLWKIKFIILVGGNYSLYSFRRQKASPLSFLFPSEQSSAIFVFLFFGELLLPLLFWASIAHDGNNECIKSRGKRLPRKRKKEKRKKKKTKWKMWNWDISTWILFYDPTATSLTIKSGGRFRVRWGVTIELHRSYATMRLDIYPPFTLCCLFKSLSIVSLYFTLCLSVRLFPVHPFNFYLFLS